MSLDFELKKIKDYETKCFQVQEGERLIHNTTYSLIWSMIPIGMHQITEKNVDEVFMRLYTYERLRGAMRNKWDKTDGSDKPTPVYFTYQEVHDHIGLETNVTTTRIEAQKKLWIDNFCQDNFYRARQEIQAAKASKEE